VSATGATLVNTPQWGIHKTQRRGLATMTSSGSIMGCRPSRSQGPLGTTGGYDGTCRRFGIAGSSSDRSG
jgi:hypothetical protein